MLGTLAAFVSMLVLYRTGVLRATPRFKKMIIVAIGGYLIISLASLVAFKKEILDGMRVVDVDHIARALTLLGIGSDGVRDDETRRQLP